MTVFWFIQRAPWEVLKNSKKRKELAYKARKYDVDHHQRGPLTKLMALEQINTDDIKDRIRKKGAVYSDNLD